MEIYHQSRENYPTGEVKLSRIVALVSAIVLIISLL